MYGWRWVGAVKAEEPLPMPSLVRLGKIPGNIVPLAATPAHLLIMLLSLATRTPQAARQQRALLHAGSAVIEDVNDDDITGSNSNQDYGLFTIATVFAHM